MWRALLPWAGAGRRFELVLALEFAGVNEEPVANSGLQRVRARSGNFGVHALDVHAVNESLRRHGV